MIVTAVRVRGLRKRYGGVVAVDGIDLDIQQGEVFGLLGPNGAGKTTTVEILEGYRARDSGEVDVLGMDPGKAPNSWRDRIGVVWQSTADTPELTVAEIIGNFARYYRHPRDPGRVMEQVELTEQAGKRVHALSGGQRRRLDVALGIIGDPDLLFLDEPTTGLDPEARRRFADLIRGLAAEGTTILLTSHYLDEVETLAGRIAVIARGKIVAEGSPKTLGGRATAVSTVQWVGEDGLHTIETDTPAKAVADLYAESGEVAGLTVTRPTLEDVYLKLIGADDE
ncbi:ABC transporter [Planobispora rosea]|uniref:ABC transporter n=1 Tax=Planobispora rosea TaxID=35762 RepID=A0A8J3WDY3_PLARO|nr:ABC transporter ATP-binding protein [Planobispora rosea]GGS78093.1 ABC transporter [Planobispora rosea]GIH85638.1 ABC transporter [Planobispora rosea]